MAEDASIAPPTRGDVADSRTTGARFPSTPKRRKPGPTAAAPDPRVPEALTLCALALAVLWVYCPIDLLRGGTLVSSDHFTLHVRRLDFAREQLFGPLHRLPAWYPREFLGTPFWSNLQNFPLIPTRLPLLLADPWSAQAIGVNLAAVLSAGFAYLFTRRLGLGRLGAAVAGWTFACCGFFVARVLAGHLPLLEAYPALPLLLWLVERYAASASPRALRLNLLTLALAAGAVMLAGHPQLPVYAVGAALVYLPVRVGGRAALVGAASVAAGVGCAAFALLPMLLLVGRSTRVLHLDPAANDVWFPVWRLKALILPWADGWPPVVAHVGPYIPFMRAGDETFWDTVCYCGWLPPLAAAALGLRALLARRLPAGKWLLLTALGAGALLLALPWPGSTGPAGAWTILRSPARQVYVTVFALALAAGAGIDALWDMRARAQGARARAIAVALAALLVAHGMTLHAHASAFVRTFDRPADSELLPAVAAAVGDGGRVAMDTDVVDPMNRRMDDVGVFDSILLARPYRALLALSGMPARTNVQNLSGPLLGPRALAWSGVRVVMSTHGDLSLPVLRRDGAWTIYTVPDPLPRAGFVPAAGVTRAGEEEVLRELRGGAQPRADRMFLSYDAAAPVAPSTAPSPGAEVKYRRTSPDEIAVGVRASTDGYVRVVEAFDPGWTATVDGRPTEILLADSFLSAVPVGSGNHVLRLTYTTPGANAGRILSLCAAAALGALLLAAPRLRLRLSGSARAA